MAGYSLSKFGPYQLLARIGAGATSSVYRVRKEGDESIIALKILNVASTQDERWRRRFERESLILRRLEHRNIVTCLDCGEMEGLHFIAMELIEGHSGRTLAGRKLDGKMLARLGSQIASGLAAAHSQDLVHRDLKPDNMVVAQDGVAKILDFGLARPVDPDGGRMPPHLARLTGTGMVIGTPRYMSPEQSRGEVLTGATDMFCLGLSLFEISSGRHPFSAVFAQEVVEAISSRPAPSLEQWRSDLPESFHRTIAALLSKEPGERPTAEEASAQFLALTQ